MARGCTYDGCIIINNESWSSRELKRCGINTDIITSKIILNSDSPSIRTVIWEKLLASGIITEDYDKDKLKWILRENAIHSVEIPGI